VRLANDDCLSNVSSVYLGPRGTTLPFQVRYASYGVGAAVMVAMLVLERHAGIAMSVASFAWSILLTVGLTSWLMRFVDYERPVRTMVTTFWQEVSAPRRPAAQRWVVKAPRLAA